MDIEKKALALVNEVAVDFRVPPWDSIDRRSFLEDVLCRALERHEAFRREVSEAAERLLKIVARQRPWLESDADQFASFIIPQPDPLVEAVKDCQFASLDAIEDYVAKQLRAAIEKRGGKIVWGEG